MSLLVRFLNRLVLQYFIFLVFLFIHLFGVVFVLHSLPYWLASSDLGEGEQYGPDSLFPIEVSGKSMDQQITQPLMGGELGAILGYNENPSDFKQRTLIDYFDGRLSYFSEAIGVWQSVDVDLKVIHLALFNLPKNFFNSFNKINIDTLIDLRGFEISQLPDGFVKVRYQSMVNKADFIEFNIKYDSPFIDNDNSPFIINSFKIKVGSWSREVDSLDVSFLLNNKELGLASTIYWGTNNDHVEIIPIGGRTNHTLSWRITPRIAPIYPQPRIWTIMIRDLTCFIVLLYLVNLFKRVEITYTFRHLRITLLMEPNSMIPM